MQRRAPPPSSSNKLPAVPPSGGGNKAGSAGGGACYVNGNGELMVDVVVGSGKGGGGRRVMVLADGRAEAAGALQWALSQAVRSDDTVVLLAVAKPPVARDGRSVVSLLGLMCRVARRRR